MPTWADKLEAYSALAAVLVAIVSAVLVVLSLRQAASALRSQTVSSDTQTVLTIWERLDSHWQRFVQAGDDSEKRKFEFGQLASYYEMACALFRDDVLTTNAARSLEEHLEEILPAMRKHPEFNALFTELTSQDSTFSNIRWFCDVRRPITRRRLLGA
jgi:hypothetical protein